VAVWVQEVAPASVVLAWALELAQAWAPVWAQASALALVLVWARGVALA
jgi:hypothetical protein